MKTRLRKSVGGPTWGRWSLAAALAAGLTLAYAAPTSAALVADAQVTATVPGDPVLAFQTMAQTFKAVHGGQLSEVDLHYGNQWFASAVKAQIWTVSGGNLMMLKSTAFPAGNVPFTADWHPFPLTTTVRVDPGQTYAIVLTSGTAGSNRWSYNVGAGYTDGTMLVLSRGTWSTTGLQSGAAFLFKTWVDTTSAPVLTAGHDTPASTAVEGTPPTMTGTYQNNTGNVKLLADHGQVVAGPTAGTWKWTGDLYDEDTAPSAVTVTVTDSASQTATTTFPLTITAVKPTAGISTGALKAAALSTATTSTPEGSSLTLKASVNAPAPADQAGVLTYKWTATKNGVALPEAGGASYTVTTTDEDTFVVSLTVTDDGGMASDPVAMTVVGAEIRPTPTITSIALADPTVTFVAPQQTLNFNGTVGDPSPETHTFRWNFGDGASATTLAASHAYASGGTYPVTLTVTDDEGVAGTATTTVKVLTTQQALAAMIASVQGLSSLNQGQQNSLIAKLNAASASAARGDNKTAGNQLNAFLNELEADMKTGKISAAAYNALRADAHAVQGALGTYNRFLEWWPLPA